MMARDFFFFFFLSVFHALKMQLPCFFFSPFFALTAGGREVRIALQLFHLLLHHVFNQTLPFRF